MTRATTRTALARIGFARPAQAARTLHDVEPALAGIFGLAADPDGALEWVSRLVDAHPERTRALLGDEEAAGRLIRVVGASDALAEYLLRHPAELEALSEDIGELPSRAELAASMRSAVDAAGAQGAVDALRLRYRGELLRIATWDLAHADPLAAVSSVAEALSDLAGATLDAALTIARQASRFPPGEVEAVRLAIIGMGKAGARELNYRSDVDVVYVAEAAASDVSADRAVEIGIDLAKGVSAAVHGVSREPALWELDAGLRPEGKDGALVRTLGSYVAYYERWAQPWEFQALLKARPLAGDHELGERFTRAIAPFVWSSASRDGFVASVQRMRERVTENIPASERDIQLKLGPGGLRDVEFTIQLLQLVHGQVDESVRQRDTLGALEALAEHGYIGRAESAEFSHAYRFLRLLEHRLQLRGLRRTHVMPRDADALRVLARATGVAAGEQGLTERWQAVKASVRSLHERLFYRPLLSAVAALPGEEFTLTSEQAVARLAGVGFVDPEGALRHIRALTSGISRRAVIQRNLLPVLLQWFAEGADPDLGLLTFRRVSEKLGESHWYLRMLRDSSLAARRLTRLLAGSRYVSELLLAVPEAVAWLDNDDDLVPRSLDALLDEGAAIVRRHHSARDAAAAALRTMRRREILRTAIGSMVGGLDTVDAGVALTNITTATISSALAALRGEGDGLEFGVIAMGRYGGRELGYGSDADVLYVFRARDDIADAQQRAIALVRSLGEFTADPTIPFELDAGLRPEGKNGPLARSLDAYRAYYERWSLTWESQALLRARPVAGDAQLLEDFAALADTIRFSETVSEHDLREVRRIKARVESERLPQGADPARHLKLGRGSLSDVEWLVQLLQLEHGARIAGLRTPSTLEALAAAKDAGLVSPDDAEVLREAWLMSSRVRSALTLWTAKTTDVLPRATDELDGVARLVGYPPRSAGALENDYLRVTRRSRAVFERLFYS